jgi:hypothetical protein
MTPCTVQLCEHKPGRSTNPDSTSVPFLLLHPFVSIYYVIKNKISSHFTKLSTRNLPGSKGQLALKGDTLTAICKPTA